MTQLTAMKDGWIKWAGGDCPVGPYALVATRFRNGNQSDCAPATHWIDRWSDAWMHTGPDSGENIIAYRVVQS